MSEADYLCPVCEKEYIDSFDTFEACPECGWEINTPQFNDHDMSDGRNALNVHEHKVLYAAMKNPKTSAAAKELRKVFFKERWDIKEMMRECATGNSAEDFAIALPAFTDSRNRLITALEALLAEANK